MTNDFAAADRFSEASSSWPRSALFLPVADVLPLAVVGPSARPSPPASGSTPRRRPGFQGPRDDGQAVLERPRPC